MKRCLFLLSLMLLSKSGFTRQGIRTPDQNAANVDCYYSREECNGKTVVLLRFDDRNSTPVTISRMEKFTTAQVPLLSPGIEPKQMVLAAGVTELSGCTDQGTPSSLFIEPMLTMWPTLQALPLIT